MPATMGSGPMKDQYISDLESNLARKVHKMPPGFKKQAKVLKMNEIARKSKGSFPMDAGVNRKPGKFGL